MASLGKSSTKAGTSSKHHLRLSTSRPPIFVSLRMTSNDQYLEEYRRISNSNPDHGDHGDHEPQLGAIPALYIYVYRYRLVHHDHSSSDGTPGAFLRRLVWLCLQSRSIRITKQEHIETINFMGVPGVPNFKKCPKFPFQSISVSIIRGDPHAVGNC